MSFSRNVKEELARVTTAKGCCQRAELAALVRSAGALQFSRGLLAQEAAPGAADEGRRPRAVLQVETGQSAVARKLILLGKAVLGSQPQVIVRRQQRLRRSQSYSVQLLSLNPQRDLVRLGVLSADGGLERAIPEELTAHNCCRRSYLRGLFLGAGSVTDPSRSHHLEIVVRDEVLADAVGQLLFSFGIAVRMTSRRGDLVLYLKEADQIGRLLATMGAHQALLEYENTLALKTVKNRVNRLVNAETANLEKVVDAALRQAEDIRYIQDHLGFQHLSPSLRELAELRLAHPDSSLKELGELCSPPLGKSGVAHRLRRLEALAGELRGDSAKASKPST